MPVTLTYPGVYVEEISSGVRTITGVATSITAFVGRAKRGPTDEPITVNSFGDFERVFGGLWIESSLGYAVRDFYLNGGSQAIIVRVHQGGINRKLSVSLGNDQLPLQAENPGAWATGIEISASPVTGNTELLKNLKNSLGLEDSDQLYNLDVKLKDDQRPDREIMRETFRNVIASKPHHSRHLSRVLENESRLLRVVEGGGVATDDLGIATESLKQAVDGTSQALGNATLQLPESGAIDWATISTALGGVEQKMGILETQAQAVEDQIKGIVASELAKLETDQALKTLVAAIKTPPVTPEELTQLSTALDTENDAQKTVLDKSQRALAAQQAAADAVKLVADAKQKAQDAKTKVANAGESEAAKKSARQGAIGAANQALQGVAKLLPGISTPGTDGDALKAESFIGDGYEADNRGLYALKEADLFNLLCIPPYTATQDVEEVLITAAIQLCKDLRAMLIIDPPSTWTSVEKAIKGIEQGIGEPSENAAVFFPRLHKPDPLRENQLADFAPCGAIAGIMARTDTQRGVWKAPAGLDATLVGVPQLSLSLTNDQIGRLNPLGINCLRTMPAAGRVVWGSRTRRGDDKLSSEWKYIPVRRTAIFIEESLYRGLQWVVFEPNDEPLWASIRLNAGAFMQNLFRQGAFQGSSPREAYFVKCDKETTTQNDINLGIVNIVVGFAPLKPAEFVVIKLQQMTGQIAV